MSDIWVIAENAVFANELVAGAKEIGQGANVVAFVGGEDVSSVAAGKVYAMPLPADKPFEAYAPVIIEKAQASAPRAILVGATRRGRDMAATIAAALDAPCVSDCMELKFDGATATASRMIYGGLAVKTMTTDAACVVAIVGAKAFEPATGAAGEVETLAPADCKVKVLERKAKDQESVNLGDANVVVGVGRGFTDQADLSYAEDLAKAMGGEIACSRPIAEFFKWLPEERYIGISGQVIKPQVYVAAGISGQAQHTFGVRDAKVIVGINKDENALICQLSDYYIIGDIKEVLPALTAAFANK